MPVKDPERKDPLQETNKAPGRQRRLKEEENAPTQ
jgi:hypothetical protein